MYTVNVCLLLAVYLLTPQMALSYKILIHPWTTGFNSRLLNMQKMADILAADGHDVTVLLSNKVQKHNIVKRATVLEYQVSDSAFLMENMNFVEIPKLTLWNYDDTVRGFFTFTYEYCKGIVADKDLMDKLRKKRFDLLLMEMFDECNRVLVSHFNVPAISYQNHGYPSYSSLMYPQLFGMNCVTFGSDNCVSDDMTFVEKLKNIIIFYKFNRLLPEGRKKYVDLAKEHKLDLHEDVDLVFEKNIVLLNADNVLHEPWPSMPHVFMISGLFNKAPSPLPNDLEQFVQGSAPHGVVILSFGTLVSSFKRETAELFAKVFSTLPQRVIMRYKGQLDNRGNNTLLSDWIPQTDLLAHPLTKAFVTHCGISATFEAAYSGIPVVTVPLFAEQGYNSHKLVKRRGMGVEVNFNTVTQESLTKALEEVINNPKYKANALKTAKLLKAQPIPPKQQFLQLINYTIETGGAKHLIHDLGIHMMWYEKFGLDVIAVVLVGLVSLTALVLLLVCCVIKAIRKSFSKNSTKKQKSN